MSSTCRCGAVPMFAISTGYRDHREWAMSWLSIGAAGLEAVDHSGMDVRDP